MNLNLILHSKVKILLRIS